MAKSKGCGARPAGDINSYFSATEKLFRWFSPEWTVGKHFGQTRWKEMRLYFYPHYLTAKLRIRSQDIEAGKQSNARMHEINSWTAASALFPVELKHFIHFNLVNYFAIQLAFCIPNPAVMSSQGRKRPTFQTANRPDDWLQFVKGRCRQNPGSV